MRLPSKYVCSYIDNHNLDNRGGDGEEPEEKVGSESFSTSFGDNFKDNITLHNIVDDIEKDKKWEVGVVIEPVARNRIGKDNMSDVEKDEQNDDSKFDPIFCCDSYI